MWLFSWCCLKGGWKWRGVTPALSQWQACEPTNQKGQPRDLGTPWTITGRWVLQVRMSPDALTHSTWPVCLKLLPLTCAFLFTCSILPAIFRASPAAVFALWASVAAPQGCFCSPGLVTGICNPLADVRESLHGLFSLCFSVFNLQIKLWKEDKKNIAMKMKINLQLKVKGRKQSEV